MHYSPVRRSPPGSKLPVLPLEDIKHALHEGAINAVHLSAGFAVTGGADRKLRRIWFVIGVVSLYQM